MARRTAIVTIDAEGRDKGKRFLLTEVPASQAEDFAARAFLGLARAGFQVPDDIAQGGLAGLAALGVRALPGMAWSDLKPLLDEMFATLQILPDPAHPNVVRSLLESDVEEVATRLKLRSEIIKLHFDFSAAESRSTSASAETSTVANTPNT